MRFLTHLLILPTLLLTTGSAFTQNTALAEELDRRRRLDAAVQQQFAARLTTKPIDELIEARDRVFADNCEWAQTEFASGGLGKFRAAGPQAANDFWLLVQHCDGNPDFQRRVLAAMRADTASRTPLQRREMAYLTDRTLRARKLPQRYGTQIDQRENFSISLDRIAALRTVDSLRLSEGLEPLAVYYNDYLEWHQAANEAIYARRGISQPLRFAMPSSISPPYELLRRELEEMYEKDQGYRQKISAGAAYDADFVRRMNEQDSLNQLRVGQFLEAYCWLPERRIGERAADAIFFIVQHGKVEVMEEYLPQLRCLADCGEAKKTHAAMLEDRIRMYRGKRQIYGTQARSRPSKTGQAEYFIWPIEDPAGVNERRKMVGFSTTVEENAAGLGATYSPNESLPKE